MPKSEFPTDYLIDLERNHREKIENDLDPAGRMLMYSGARLNWIGELINDESIRWDLRTVPVDELVFTGTSPEWNEVLIDRAERNPTKLRELLKNPEISQMFQKSKFHKAPILTRNVDSRLFLLDGTNRTIAAIRDGIPEIDTYVGSREGPAKPKVEPHVVYDLLKAYQQGRGSEEDFRGGLRFLIDAYVNVEELLLERFSSGWLPDDKIQGIIHDVLER